MKIEDMLDNVVVGELGVIRWKSNGQIPPEDCLQELEKWISFNRYLSSMIREEEDANFLTRYKEQQKNRVYSEEELNEMRSAFGKGATVVDVITGKEIQL